MRLHHRPRGLSEGRVPTDAYAVAKLTDGYAFECCRTEEALSFRKYSQAFQTALRSKADAEATRPTSGNENLRREPVGEARKRPMVCKTMIGAPTNLMPKSIQFAGASEVERLAEAGSRLRVSRCRWRPTTRTTCHEAAWCRSKSPPDAATDTPEQRPNANEHEDKTRAPSQSNKVIEARRPR